MKVKNDGHMLYINGQNYIRQNCDDGKFYHCDVEGIAKGEDLEHIGDSFDSYSECKFVCDFYANGGHWMNLENAYKEAGIANKTEG